MLVSCIVVIQRNIVTKKPNYFLEKILQSFRLADCHSVTLDKILHLSFRNLQGKERYSWFSFPLFFDFSHGLYKP